MAYVNERAILRMAYWKMILDQGRMDQEEKMRIQRLNSANDNLATDGEPRKLTEIEEEFPDQ